MDDIPVGAGQLGEWGIRKQNMTTQLARPKNNMMPIGRANLWQHKMKRHENIG